MRSAVLLIWTAFIAVDVAQAETYSTSSVASGLSLTGTSTFSTIVPVPAYPWRRRAAWNTSVVANSSHASVLVSASKALLPPALSSNLSTTSDPLTSIAVASPTAGTLSHSTTSSSSSTSFIFGTTTLSISGLSTASQTTTILAGQTTPTVLPVFPCPPCKTPSNAIIVFPIAPDFPPPDIDIPPPPGLDPIHIGPDGNATPVPNLPLPTPIVPTAPLSPPPGDNPTSPDPTGPSASDNGPTSQQTASSETSNSPSEVSSSISTSSSSSSSTGNTVTVTGGDNWPAVNTAAAASLGQILLAEQSSFYACSTPVGLFSVTGSCSSTSPSSAASPKTLSTSITTNLVTSSSISTLSTSSTPTSSPPPTPSSLATTFSCVQPRPTDAPSLSTLLPSFLHSDEPISTWISQVCSLPSSQLFSPALEDRSVIFVGNASFYIMQITRSSVATDLQSCTTGLGAVLDCVANQGFYGGLWQTENEYYNVTNPEAPRSPFAGTGTASPQ